MKVLEEWKRRHQERFEQPSDEVLEKRRLYHEGRTSSSTVTTLEDFTSRYRLA